MVGHGRSSASSYLADPTSSIPSQCASIVVTSTLRVKLQSSHYQEEQSILPVGTELFWNHKCKSQIFNQLETLTIYILQYILDSADGENETMFKAY